MNLITRFELASRSDAELDLLHREVFTALIRSAAGSPERRNALISLEIIEDELAARLPHP